MELLPSTLDVFILTVLGIKSCLIFLLEHILHFQFHFLTNVVCIQYLKDKIEASVNNTLEEDAEIQNVTIFSVNCKIK